MTDTAVGTQPQDRSVLALVLSIVGLGFIGAPMGLKAAAQRLQRGETSAPAAIAAIWVALAWLLGIGTAAATLHYATWYLVAAPILVIVPTIVLIVQYQVLKAIRSQPTTHQPTRKRASTAAWTWFLAAPFTLGLVPIVSFLIIFTRDVINA